MFVLGLLLILVSAGALVAVIASGTDDQAVMYGGSVHLPTLVVFLAGAVALLLFILGLELVRSGLKRAHQNRRNAKRLRKLERREAATAPASGPGPASEAATSTTSGEASGAASRVAAAPTAGSATSTASPSTGSATPAAQPDPPPGQAPPSASGGPYQTPPPPR
jgi:uncharacterized integral membrane protein